MHGIESTGQGAGGQAVAGAGLHGTGQHPHMVAGPLGRARQI